jgi:hypothetical protein
MHMLTEIAIHAYVIQIMQDYEKIEISAMIARALFL